MIGFLILTLKFCSWFLLPIGITELKAGLKELGTICLALAIIGIGLNLSDLMHSDPEERQNAAEEQIGDATQE